MKATNWNLFLNSVYFSFTLYPSLPLLFCCCVCVYLCGVFSIFSLPPPLLGAVTQHPLRVLLSVLVFLMSTRPYQSLSFSATHFPGWPLPSTFSGYKQLLGAGAPEAAPGDAGWSRGTPSRGWAAAAHHHYCHLCPAGSVHRGSGTLWTKTPQRPCHFPHRATSPKARGWHLPHPLEAAGCPGQS